MGKKAKEAYLKKLRDPRWQKKRLQILDRDDWTCQECFDKESTLHVHHRYYTSGSEPWDYPDDALQTLCETCHSEEREHRPSAEAELLHALKRHFAHHEVAELARCFRTGCELHPKADPVIIMAALTSTLDRPEEQEHMIERYWARLRRQVPGKSDG